MIVFIDTNVFFNNWYVANADFKFLFNYIENTKSKLVISELVCQEVDNLHSRGIQAVISNLNAEVKKAKKLVKSVPDFDFQKLDEKYSFKEIITNKVYNTRFIPYNTIAQEVVVERALKQIRPFQEADKGYRDTLIWLSLLKYLKENEITEEVTFITNNKSDFYSSKEKSFNSDLIIDITNHCLKCKIIPYDSLYTFVTEQALKAHHEYTYSELEEMYIDNVEDQIEDAVEWYINHLGNSELKTLLDKSNTDFPLIEFIEDYTFEVYEGAEDGTIISYKKLSAEIIYVNYRFNLRRCAFEFKMSPEVFAANQSAIEKYYYNIEVGLEEVTFYSYIRPDFSISFNYYIESDVVLDVVVGSLRFM